MTEKRSDQPNAELCQFPFSDGRLCRMLRHPRHPQLCPFHAHTELQLAESHQLGAEIATTLTGHFISSADVVHVLGKVFTALAQDRIPQKKASTLAYLGQIMLSAMPQVTRETDITFTPDTWLEFVNRSHYPANSQVRRPINITPPEPPEPTPSAPLHSEASDRTPPSDRIPSRKSAPPSSPPTQIPAPDRINLTPSVINPSDAATMVPPITIHPPGNTL
jgi:hypothetical protein